MATMTKHEHGTFSWVELGTTDVPAAKKFYAGLFGWTYEDMPAGPGMVYTMASLGGRHAAAMYPLNDEMKSMGIPPNWLSYVTVDDVDATTKKAKESGGKAMKEPFDVMDVGRMSVVADPSGAVLAFWQAKKHIGAGVLNEPGALCWNEVFTTNVDAAGKFYVQTLGWKTESVDMGPMGLYTLFKRPGEEKNAAGMMAMPKEMKGVPSNWLAYFAVASCEASTKKAAELGATILQPPREIPNIGTFSVVQDPQRAVFALFETKH